MADRTHAFSHLDRLGRAAAAVAAGPRATLAGAAVAAVMLSWAVLGAMAIRGAQSRLPGVDAPGDRLLRHLPSLPLPDIFDRFFALCVGPTPLEAGTAARAAALVLMWFLMSVATMLPSAAPMLRTYCEIADTARAKAAPVVHPLVLACGYAATWFLAALVFAGLTLAIHAIVGTGGMADPLPGLAAAVALALAGAYQFSGLKQACLKKCRHPFTTLFARWSDRPARIFKLGLEQGFWCLGCCWALMLAMFAVGLMNIFWMALVGVLALVEKQTAGKLASRAAGTILLVWAACLLVVSP